MASIRCEQSGDQLAIAAIHISSFPTDAEATLVGKLRSAGRLAISLVAECDGTIIGHVAFSPVTTATGQTGLGLAPVAVMASHRRQGIAANLIQEGLARCAAAGFGWSVVLGDPAYYKRFGFRPASSCGLTDEYQGGEAFQICEVIPNAAPYNGGLVRYAPEFAVFG